MPAVSISLTVQEGTRTLRMDRIIRVTADAPLKDVLKQLLGADAVGRCHKIQTATSKTPMQQDGILELEIGLHIEDNQHCSSLILAL